eukprot:4787687-Amphidinium_carterae.1
MTCSGSRTLEDGRPWSCSNVKKLSLARAEPVHMRSVTARSKECDQISHSRVNSWRACCPPLRTPVCWHAWHQHFCWGFANHLEQHGAPQCTSM